MAGGAVTTLLFPIMARVSVHLALVARVLLGSLHAVAFPAMTGAWGVWAPPQAWVNILPGDPYLTKAWRFEKSLSYLAEEQKG